MKPHVTNENGRSFMFRNDQSRNALFVINNALHYTLYTIRKKFLVPF